MTKVEFANICNGTLLDDESMGLRYRLTQRICRKLVLARVTPYASAPLVQIIHTAAQAKDWKVVR